MLRVLRFLVFGSFLLPVGRSQQSYPFFSPSPAPPLIVTATANSPFGQSSYCYWVVVVYPIGKSTPSTPSCIPNAIETSSVLISWSAAQGASSYDVLRTTTPILPNVTSNIAVATAVSGTTQTDSFGALSSYTISSALPATANLYLDNTAYSSPQLRVVITGVGGTTAFNLSAGSTPGGTSGQVQFNNSGSFGGFTLSGGATLNTGTGVITLTGTPTFTGTVTAPAFAGSGTNAFINLPSNTSHSFSTGDFLNNAGTLQFNNGTATNRVPQIIASGTSALTTSLISSGACSSATTGAATNTVTTDVILATANGDPTATTGYSPSSNGSLYIWAYPTANTVNFKVCNNTSSSITPGGVTLNWLVIR